MEDSEKAQIGDQGEATGFSLIDVSASDDDFLLASSSDVNTMDNPGDILAKEAHINQPPDSNESKQPRKNGKCNLRKSLAWDSAFFTNAGVLDPEELSSIIEGAEASVKQKHFLPGIEEDLSKSYDSVSTLESDNLTLESLEADLFCDIRASIQKTGRPSAQGNSKGAKLRGETKSTNGCATKPVENSSGDMVKAKVAGKKLNSIVQGPSRILKPASIPRQVAKPAVRSKDSKLSLPRLTEAAVKPSLIGAAATKRTSIGSGRAKFESNAAGNAKGKVASLSKVSSQANSSKTVPKTLATSKLSSSSTVLGRTAAIRSSRSSCDSSTSSSSDTIRKSQYEVSRRKIEKNVNLAPSKTRGPSTVAVKSKSRPGDSNLSDYLKSTTKLSPSISPTSSISERSTESCSSTATLNQKPIGLTACPTSTQNIIMNSSVHQSQNHSSDDALYGAENQLAGSSDRSTKQSATVGAVSLSRPGAAKPSGLRLPSAKIGFFDGVKATTKTPSSGSSRSRSALPSNLPRCGTLSGISPSGTAKKPKAVIKPEPCRTDSNLKPVHLEDQSTGLQKILSADNSEFVSNTPSKMLESVLVDPGLDGDEVLSGGKHVADSSSVAATEEIKLVGVKKEESPEGKLHSPSNQATYTAEDVHDIVNTTDGVKDLSANPSSKEDRSYRTETGDVDIVSLTHESMNAYEDVSRNAVDGPMNEDQHSGCTATEEQNGHAEMPVDGFGTQVEAAKEERHESNSKSQFQNHINEDNSLSVRSCSKQICNEKSVQSANLSPGPLSMHGSEASPGTRTPFTVKNSVADLVKVYTSSSGPAAEAPVKLDTLPSQEGLKENC